jgi:hypothetical protein
MTPEEWRQVRTFMREEVSAAEERLRREMLQLVEGLERQGRLAHQRVELVENLARRVDSFAVGLHQNVGDLQRLTDSRLAAVERKLGSQS